MKDGEWAGTCEALADLLCSRHLYEAPTAFPLGYLPSQHTSPIRVMSHVGCQLQGANKVVIAVRFNGPSRA